MTAKQAAVPAQAEERRRRIIEREIPAELRDDLLVLSRAIHADPELAYQEHRAVQRIVALLRKYGHEVELGIGGLPTAFRARIGPPGRSAALLAEYDALPEIGHACGHNLIAMSNVGAFLLAGLNARGQKLAHGIELIGTPAEESGGGKLDLLDAGVFKDTIAALSSHPSSDAFWSCGGASLGITAFRVRFHGVAAHAAVSPDQGKNALNGAIRLFIGVDGWRQHLPSDARVHGIITKGGAAQNIIPDLAEADFGVRAKELATLEAMVEQFKRIAEGAALQTDTTVEIEESMRMYQPVKADERITELLAATLEGLEETVERGAFVWASTDFGNVSQAMAADYISFPVADAETPGHSIAFREAAGRAVGEANALATAIALARAATPTRQVFAAT
ncbi:MAG: amidohydrolase [Candidatus Limnocylindria bacterium]